MSSQIDLVEDKRLTQSIKSVVSTPIRLSPRKEIRRFGAALIALALFATQPALARDYDDGSSSQGYYRSTDGSAVHGPTRNANAAYGKVTADCRDGTHSYSHHHSGTCSGHGGVDGWR